MQPAYGYAPAAPAAPAVVEQPAPAPLVESTPFAAPAQPPATMQQAPAPAPAAPQQPAPAPQTATPPAPATAEQPAAIATSEARPPAAEKPVEAASVAPAPGDAAEPTRPEETFFRSMNEGAAAFAAGDYDKARHAFVMAILNSAGQPGNIDAKLAYAITQFAIGDYHVAAMLIRQVVPENPLVVHAEFNLADRYEKKDLLARQTEALQTHIKTHPQDADPLIVLGFVQHFSGQREQAKQTFAEALKLSPRDAVAAVFLNPPPMPAAPATQPASPAPTTQPAGNVSNLPTTRPAARVDAPAEQPPTAPAAQAADALPRDI